MIPDINTYIPEDIFWNKKAHAMRLQYSNFGISENDNTSLQVAPNAFRLTRNFTSKSVLDTLDCNEMNFTFVLEFSKLTSLTLFRIENIHLCLHSLPELPRTLTRLEISFPTGINELSNLPTIINGLTVAYFWGFSKRNPTLTWNVEIMKNILDWIFLSSAKTLNWFSFCAMNLFTQVPSQISSFEALNRVWLKYN